MVERLTGSVLFAAAIALTAGCGKKAPPELNEIAGDVLVGGQPLEGVQVRFWPDSANGENFGRRFGFGMTDENGHFILKTQLEKGDYHVTFTRFVDPSGKLLDLNDRDVPDKKESIALPYSDLQNPENSPAKATVTSGHAAFRFELPAATH